MFKCVLIVCAFFTNVAVASTYVQTTFDVEQVKQEVTIELAQELKGSPHARPFLLLIGGFPGSGKTTLIKALSETHDFAIIAWNAMRQSLLNRKIYGSPFDGEILETVHKNLFRLCLQRHVNVVIDTNSYARNIREFEKFLREEEEGQIYKVVKICLNPPVETLFRRLRAREHKEGVHQGKESDLLRDLNSSRKKIDFNDYALIINTEEVPFQTELEMVNSYLEVLGIEN